MEEELSPLSWERVGLHNRRKTVTGSFFQKVVSHLSDQSGYFETHKNVCAILKQREASKDKIGELWGKEPVRTRVAKALCQILKEEYAWTNSLFLPEDNFEVAFMMPWDDLDIVEVALSLEKELGLKLADEEVTREGAATLGSFVDFIVGKMKA